MENLGMDTHQENTMCEDEVDMGWHDYQPQGDKSHQRTSKSWEKGLEGGSPSALRRNPTRQSLDLFWSSRTVRWPISVVQGTRYVVLCYGSPRKWTQLPHRVKTVLSLLKARQNPVCPHMSTRTLSKTNAHSLSLALALAISQTQCLPVPVKKALPIMSHPGQHLSGIFDFFCFFAPASHLPWPVTSSASVSLLSLSSLSFLMPPHPCSLQLSLA